MTLQREMQEELHEHTQVERLLWIAAIMDCGEFLS